MSTSTSFIIDKLQEHAILESDDELQEHLDYLLADDNGIPTSSSSSPLTQHSMFLPSNHNNVPKNNKRARVNKEISEDNNMEIPFLTDAKSRRLGD